jgi:hypothetical protein
VHVPRVWQLAAIVAAACGLAAVGTVPALAQPAQTPTVTISAQSAFRPITHDVFVVYKDTHKGTHLRYDQVAISGSVSQSTAGQVAALFAQPFPYKATPKMVAGQSVTLPTSTTPVSYKFKATPTIATKYTVEVLPSSTTSSPVVATSPTTPVYVVTFQTARLSKCGRPVCHETLTVYTHLPNSAYRSESTKKSYFYFGLRLSKTGKPSFPRWLYLDKKASISKARRVSSTEFKNTIKWSFRVGNDGYAFAINFCAKNSESRDGINLPGTHSCGVKKIRSTISFLG